MFKQAKQILSMLMAKPSGGPVNEASGSAYDFEFPGIDGTPIKLADWAGQVVLVVNTASFCGYTKQYKALQSLWDSYRSKGLIVLGVPCNDFGRQEPKDEGEIQAFCTSNFGVTFPMTAKQIVVGPHAHPFYKWAQSVMGPSAVPNWNFHKYLVGRDGQLLRSFSTRVDPASADFVGSIEAALG